MKFGLEPIRNDTPYKRLGQDPKPAEPEQGGIKSTWQICQEITERAEQARIWGLIRETASGTNAPSGENG